MGLISRVSSRTYRKYFINMAHGLPPKIWQPPECHLETNCGKIEIELYWNHAPQSCRNFAELCRRGYYDRTKFHRIIRDFMIQGGDPSATGRGGKSIYGAKFDDELTPVSSGLCYERFWKKTWHW